MPVNKRPLLLTILCVLGVLGCLYAAILILAGNWLVPPTAAERAAALIAVAVALISLIGLWRMRRWGLILLAVALVGRTAFAMASRQPWLTPAIIGPVAILLVGLLYVRRMA